MCLNINFADENVDVCELVHPEGVSVDVYLIPTGCQVVLLSALARAKVWSDIEITLSLTGPPSFYYGATVFVWPPAASENTMVI